MDQYLYGNLRVQFYGDIIRVERSFRGRFFDGNTFFIPDRNSLPKGKDVSAAGGVLYFGEYTLRLPEKGIRGLRLEKNGKPVYRYQKLQNCGALPSPSKTPDVFVLSDRPRILFPEGGYSVRRKGDYRIREEAEDVYLLFAEGDPKRLRRLYVELTGRSELPRLSTFGGWNSKYYAYTQEEAKKVIFDYEEKGVPLDVLVIDTDWRSSKNGIGYDINTELFPDMKGFFAFAHSHGVEIMFNDHPEPFGKNVFDGTEIAYRERHLQDLLRMGLDIWWYDRNWQTHLLSPTPAVQWESLGLYLYHAVTKQYFEKAASEGKSGKAPRRPVVMGNVVEIANGEFCGISDSASHRYGIQWTGDIASTSCALAQEIGNLVLCGENGIPYMNSDCGGHTGNPDKEQFIRWMQYGVFSPVFRPHCTNSVRRTREPWQYDEETVDIVRDYVRLRMRLLPYLYSLAREAYDTGLPMFRSLALEYPKDRRASRSDEYLLGKNLLIAPICGAAPSLLGEKDFVAPVDVTFFDGRECKGEPLAHEVWKKIAMCLRHEPPTEGVPAYDFSARLRTKIVLEKPLRLYLKNDDGATVTVDGKRVLEDRDTHSATLNTLADLDAGEHSVEIEYFQAGGEAFLGLYAGEVKEENEREIYLPEGMWMDLFDGRVYAGKRTLRKRYSLSSMPLFVRLGALLPLYEDAQNTHRLNKSRVVFDFYPEKGSADEGVLYEDDGETTAYKEGNFLKTAYGASFSEEENAFIFHMGAGAGEYAVPMRDVTVKYHLLKGADNVLCVYVDGKSVPFGLRKRKGGKPLSCENTAPDGGILTVSFHADPTRAHTVKFLLG